MNKYLRSFSLILAFLFFSILGTLAQIPKHVKANDKTKLHSQTKRQLSYVIIKSEGNTFGYNILDHNRPFVHQPSVPGLPGNKGFSTKEDAVKVAKLVIKKINKNIMPPTVTREELKNLNIIFNP